MNTMTTKCRPALKFPFQRRIMPLSFHMWNSKGETALISLLDGYSTSSNSTFCSQCSSHGEREFIHLYSRYFSLLSLPLYLLSDITFQDYPLHYLFPIGSLSCCIPVVIFNFSLYFSFFSYFFLITLGLFFIFFSCALCILYLIFLVIFYYILFDDSMQSARFQLHFLGFLSISTAATGWCTLYHETVVFSDFPSFSTLLTSVFIHF